MCSEMWLEADNCSDYLVKSSQNLSLYSSPCVRQGHGTQKRYKYSSHIFRKAQQCLTPSSARRWQGRGRPVRDTVPSTSPHPRSQCLWWCHPDWRRSHHRPLYLNIRERIYVQLRLKDIDVNKQGIWINEYIFEISIGIWRTSLVVVYGHRGQAMRQFFILILQI